MSLAIIFHSSFYEIGFPGAGLHPHLKSAFPPITLYYETIASPTENEKTTYQAYSGSRTE